MVLFLKHHASLNYLMPGNIVESLNYNIRVRGFRSFENQEFTFVND